MRISDLSSDVCSSDLSSYLCRRNWPDKYPAHFRMLFAHSVFDVLDPRLNVPSAKIVIEIDTQHREHLIRRHMSSPHFADFTYVRFALGNITDCTDELRARPLAHQRSEERREWQADVNTCRSRWWPSHSKK